MGVGWGVGTRSWAGRARAEGVRGAGAQAPETVLSRVRAVAFMGVGSFYPLLEYNIRTRFPPACTPGSKVAHTHAGGTLTAMAAALARSTPPFTPVTWPDRPAGQFQSPPSCALTLQSGRAQHSVRCPGTGRGTASTPGGKPLARGTRGCSRQHHPRRGPSRTADPGTVPPQHRAGPRPGTPRSPHTERPTPLRNQQPRRLWERRHQTSRSATRGDSTGACGRGRGCCGAPPTPTPRLPAKAWECGLRAARGRLG